MNSSNTYKGKNNNQIGHVNGVGINYGNVTIINNKTAMPPKISKFKKYLKKYGLTAFELAKYLRIQTHSSSFVTQQNEIFAQLTHHEEDVELTVIYALLHKLDITYESIEEELNEANFAEYKIRERLGLYIHPDKSHLYYQELDWWSEEYKNYRLIAAHNQKNANFIAYLIAFAYINRNDLDLGTICFMLEAELEVPDFCEAVCEIATMPENKNRLQNMIEFFHSISAHLHPFC